METKNYKLTVAYDGTRYLGWQKLGERGSKDYARTIQGKLETLLSKMTGEEIEVNGAGRTDAGVHAAGQTANFRTAQDIAPAEIVAYCNQYLPGDIAVLDVREVPPRFHARLHARGKLYCYRLHNSPTADVFRQRFEYRVAEPLDTAAMEEAAKRLCGTHDFRPFCASKRTKKSTVRTVDAIRLDRDGAKIALYFHGDGFLYNMVRILTGTLIEVGLGRMRPEEIDAIFAGERPAGYTAPAHGLMLERVDYDEM
ncbi:MAG: tRNA pseudouridine(38-40) synthase TruA [Oscillospiraceae bacterium]